MSERRLSAGVVVARETQDGARLLLLRAFRDWDFPKGGVEAGEDPLAAAIRETEEETGIADLEFVWGREHCDTAPYANNKVARYFVARTRTEDVVLGVNPKLGQPEHHEYRWVDLTEAFALTAPRLKPVIAWAAGKIMLATQLASR